MIANRKKSNCCGCSACVQRCPRQCISMVEDKEGFLYPSVDETKCVNCGLCEKVCPTLNQGKECEPLSVYAAKNSDETIRMVSSSGGVFSMLAERIIEKEGVVFGACWNSDWEVVHGYTESISGIERFRGSKYVQSRVDGNYKKVESFLKDGRYVMFSGTPCQIAGLKRYLRKEYEKLVTVDFICHGVPSPGVFRTYLQEEINKEIVDSADGGGLALRPCIPLVTGYDGIDYNGLKIKSISFRDKRNGWKKFGFTFMFSKEEGESLLYSTLDENLFLIGFLRDLYLRPSCYACPAKQLKSGSDVTLGDFWGVDSLMPEIDDDKGVSAVTVNTDKGRELLLEIEAELHEVPYIELVNRNPALVKSAAIPKCRKRFFKNNSLTFERKIKVLTKEPITLKRILKKILRLLIPQRVRKLIRRFVY